MTNFTGTVDLIFYFLNEHIKPGNKVLLISPDNNYKNIIQFYHSEVFSISSIKSLDKKNIFDIVISFEKSNVKEILEILKTDGKVLIKGAVFNRCYSVQTAQMVVWWSIF